MTGDIESKVIEYLKLYYGMYYFSLEEERF